MTDAAGAPSARAASELGIPAACAIFAAALLLRALHLWQIHDAPFFSLLMGDAEGYQLWALEIAGGDWLGDRIFYQAPFYPYLLGTIYFAAGESPTLVKLFQALLGASSCVLLAVAGTRLFSRRVGITAGALLAAYAPAIFFEGLLQKSALDLFLVCVLLCCVAELSWRQSPARWLALGTSLAALILTRENALVLLAPIAVWAAWMGGSELRERALPLLWISLGVALLLLPVALRNLAVGGELHLTTSQFGTNFYIGNHPGATGSYTPLRYGRGTWEHEREDATALAELEAGRALSPAEVSAHWTERALAFIAEQPKSWALLMGRKLRLLANAEEAVDTEDQYTHAEWSWPLRVSGRILHFGVIAPLALLGVLVSWRQRRKLGLLLAMAACYAGSVLLFYVFARYRQPLVPFLLLFAAAGLVGFPSFVREQSRSVVAASIMALLAVALFCNWPMQSQAAMRSATHFNMGLLLQRQGDFSAARDQLDRALVFDPDNALAHHAVGTLLLSQGDSEAAARSYRAALARKPNHAPTHARLGMTLSRRGRMPEAVDAYRRALELDPELALAHYNLGLSLLVLGRFDEARGAFREAVRLEPSNRERLAGRALALASSGDPGGSMAGGALRLAQLAVESGEGESAIVLDALAAAYASNRQLALAETTAEAAVALAAGDPAVSREVEREMRARLERYRSGR